MQKCETILTRRVTRVYPLNMSDTPELINIKRLAERLGVSRRTVHYWLERGGLPVAPIEGMTPPKWRAADVEAWLSRASAAE